ncbi:MAG: recombinase family protein [Alphaproteobacteria bacterium]
MTAIRAENSYGRKALIYCRVSGKKQTKDGSGLDSQEYRCRQYAEAKGYEVVQVFPDDVSGGGDFILRKGMVALLGYLDARPSETFIVIFDDLKRYSRETEFYLKLRRIMNDRGAILECLNFTFQDTPEGKFTETISVAAGTLEREQMARQNRQKAKARIEQGYCVRAVPPVGFKYVKAQGGGKVLVHDEPLASIVKEALEGFASGRFQSQAEVVRFLEAQPEFPKNLPNGRIRRMTVKRMLTQILYAGYIAAPNWGVSMREARHEEIVSKETFRRIQERLEGRPVMPARKELSADFPLRGAVACASCGYSLTGGWSKGKYKHYAYYFCHHQGCEKKGKPIPAAKLNEQFEDLMQSMNPSVGYVKLIKAMFSQRWDMELQRAQETTRHYRAKAKRLDAEIGKVVDRMLEVSNTRALKAFEDRIEALEQEKLIALEKASKKAVPLRPFSEMFELSMQFLANPYKLWENGTADMRKLVVRLAFGKPLTYDRETACLNSEKSSIFKFLEGACAMKNKMVPPARLELAHP